MLSETYLILFHADGHQQLLRGVHEVCQHLVDDYVPADGLPDGDGDLPAVLGYQGEFAVPDLAESAPALVLRVDEKLNLHHVELPHADHALAGCDLVAVPAPGLYDAQGQFLTVVSVKVRVVHEDALGRFRPQIAYSVGTGTYVRFEHEIEFLDLPQVSSALRAFYAVLFEFALKFFC